ncbi:MAG: ASKHA domain-containing protein [Defluviitaleaceae bacterium]|nr:ASKHA domain-containing protein [Defluviitaleaceae bacterium]
MICGKCKNCLSCKFQNEKSENNLEIFEKNFSRENDAAIAIDIGTTNIVFELFDLKNGATLAKFSCENSQRAFGADVISRITASKTNAAELNSYVISDLTRGVELLRRHCARKISQIAIVGNTVMLHLLQNFSCETLGVFPFSPVSVEMSRTTICGTDAVILPCVSAFIGADVVAGIFACEEKFCDEYKLFIDIGTNAEVVLFSRSEENFRDVDFFAPTGQNRQREKIFAVSAAAGTAFEGGKICGSQVISHCAELLRNKKLDRTGLLRDEKNFSHEKIQNEIFLDEKNFSREKIQNEIFQNEKNFSHEKIQNEKNQNENFSSQKFFSQADVRELQLAKSAVRAAIEIFEENIKEVFIAGLFGYKIDVDDAVEIGLFPASFKGKTTFVGNAALDGAKKFLRQPQENFFSFAKNFCEINLALHPKFDALFIKHMDFF